MANGDDSIEIPIQITELGTAQQVLDQLTKSVQSTAEKVAAVGTATSNAAEVAAAKVTKVMTGAAKAAAMSQEEFNKLFEASGAKIRGLEEQTAKSEDIMRQKTEAHIKAVRELEAETAKLGKTQAAQASTAGLATAPPGLGGAAAGKLPLPEMRRFRFESDRIAANAAAAKKSWHVSGNTLRITGDLINASGFGEGWVMKLRAGEAIIKGIASKIGLMQGFLAVGAVALAAAPIAYDIHQLAEIARLSNDTAQMLKGTSDSSIARLIANLNERRKAGELTPEKSKELLDRAEKLRREVDKAERGGLQKFVDFNLRNSAIAQFLFPQSAQAARARSEGIDPEAAQRRIEASAKIAAEARQAAGADFETRQAAELSHARTVAEVNKAIAEEQREKEVARAKLVIDNADLEANVRIAALERLNQYNRAVIQEEAGRDMAVIDTMRAQANADLARFPNDPDKILRAKQEIEEVEARRVMLRIETNTKLAAADAELDAKRQQIEIAEAHRQTALATKRLSDEIQNIERQTTAELELEDQRRESAQADFSKSDEEKKRIEIGLLEDELDIIQKQTEALRQKRIEIEQDPSLRPEVREERLRAVDSGIASAGGRGRTSARNLARLRAEADPNSIGDQYTLALVQFENRLNTFAEGVARTFASTIQGAIDGIASSMEGLIKGTMDWGDALRNLSTTILTAVIGAISRMFAEWIIKMTLIRGLESVFSTARKAETASEIPGNVANAAAASGGSFGVSGYLGLAAFLALVGAAFAFGGAFAKGGRPPRDKVSLFGEEGPELWIPDGPGTVVPAERTRQMLAQAVAGTSKGRTAGSAGSGAGRAGGGAGTIVLVDDRVQARDHIASSGGIAQVQALIRGELVKLGMATS